MPRKKAPARASTQSIDERTVERLAGLSRLSLNRQEAERLREELSSIISYFATLDAVDVATRGSITGDDGGGRLREDVVRPSNPDEILSGVPQKKGRYVKAPRVF